MKGIILQQMLKYQGEGEFLCLDRTHGFVDNELSGIGPFFSDQADAKYGNSRKERGEMNAMNKIAQRKRQRREYLWRKVAAFFGVSVATAGLMVAVLGAITFGTVAFLVFKNLDGSPIELAAILITLFIVGAIAWLGVGIHGYRAALRAKQRAQSIPHIPPVTVDTLPAEEVLVRGSAPTPAAQSDVLLRAATGHDTAKEELLRVNAE